MDMNTVKRVFLLGLAAALAATAGCKPMTATREKEPSEPPRTAAAVPPSERENFPGGCLTVKLDGTPTRESKKENNEQIWSGGVISPAPTLLFLLEEEAMGPMKHVSLVIQPLRDGQVIEGDLYQYTGPQKLIPGVAIPLNQFSRIHDNQLQSDLPALPEGNYRISLQVQGQKHWDRQRIDVQVRAKQK